MQMVGAQWLLVTQPHAAILVSLVQTADMIPDLLFGLVGGVLADLYDRRRLLIGAQACLVVCGLALTVLTFLDQMPPALLLAFTLLLGFGSVPVNPAYQSLTPDLVPRSQLAAASALGSVSINLARAVGPAIAGLVIARLGVGAVFALNTATFLVFGIVIAAWRPDAVEPPRHSASFGAAMRAGSQYIRHSPVVRRIFLRAAVFLVPGSALWALLPLVVSQRLGQGASGYGVMLGALGVGAVLGAFALPPLTAKRSSNEVIVVGSVVFGAALVALMFVRTSTLAAIVLLPAGAAWIALLSGFNATLQLFLPAWVRARGLSVYQMVFFGAQAVGSVMWGITATAFGLVPAFVAAAAMMVAGGATVGIWPLVNTEGMDRGRANYWPEPRVAREPDAAAGPVVVSTRYTIAPEREHAFLQAMTRVRGSRLRTGAVQWGIFRDAELEHEFVELFVVPSWDEHLEQHESRLTGTDRQYDIEATALSDPAPRTSHYLAVPVRDKV